MRPAQLSPQCGDNRRIREGLGELHHPAQVLLPKAPPELRLQLSPQRGDNLGAILRPLLLEDVLADPRADLPVERGQPGIDRLRHLLAGDLDHLTDVGHKSARL